MKVDKLTEYVEMYPKLYDWLYFNVVVEAPDNMSLLTDSEHILSEYIDGSTDREYIFSVAMVKHYDDGTSNVNIEAMKESQQFIEWVHENNKNKVFPDFGDKCYISEVEVLDNVPQFSVDSENNIARYMIALKVNYLERG